MGTPGALSSHDLKWDGISPKRYTIQIPVSMVHDCNSTHCPAASVQIVKGKVKINHKAALAIFNYLCTCRGKNLYYDTFLPAFFP